MSLFLRWHGSVLPVFFLLGAFLCQRSAFEVLLTRTAKGLDVKDRAAKFDSHNTVHLLKSMYNTVG